jgi:hypothetical protein
MGASGEKSDPGGGAKSQQARPKAQNLHIVLIAHKGRAGDHLEIAGPSGLEGQLGVVGNELLKAG